MDEPLRVLIIGAGRMGSLLARGMVSRHEVGIYQRSEQAGRELAAQLGCRFETPAQALPSSDALVLALPTEVTGTVLASLRDLLRPETVVINIATKVLKDSLRPLVPPGCHLVGAKIVGQFRGMDAAPAIVVDADTAWGAEVASALFACLGPVRLGDERQVQLINTLTARESFRAAIHIEDALKAAGVASELIDSALRVVAVGCFKAYADQDMGPFGREVLREVRATEGKT
jgi:pyrroline-5-carboxylate reductase